MGKSHPVSRRQVLQGMLGFAASGTFLGCDGGGASILDPASRARAEAAMSAGAAYLWSRQQGDGLFGSDVYGTLRGGQSLTPFVLESLVGLPRRFDPVAVERDERIAWGLGALLGLRDDEGALGFADSTLDYPCYATGLLLSCLGAVRPKDWERHAEPSVNWLLGQQFRSENGWIGHAAQGGWGMGTHAELTPPNAGHVDLSMTRRVLQGLRAVGLSLDTLPLREARAFVARCQAANRAFVYSPVEEGVNKGERPHDSLDATSDSPIASVSLGYGSATCDALLALDSLGLGSGRIAREGLAWLHLNHRVDRNPGVDGGPMALFAVAMRGYYRAATARCFARFGGPPNWRAAMIEAIGAEQNEDGTWRNESPLQKEDDPLIATPFALQALGDALHGA